MGLIGNGYSFKIFAIEKNLYTFSDLLMGY